MIMKNMFEIYLAKIYISNKKHVFYLLTFYNMTNFRKVVAGASAIAILTMNMINFTANAAAINNATAVVTPATDVVVTSA